MDIGIFIEYDNRVVQIPVNPEKFSVDTSGDNKTVDIITLGEVVVPRLPKLSGISWKSFFPYQDWHPAIRTKGAFESASFYLDFIDKIRNDCKPCHLTVTGIGFDSDVVIEKFNYYHQAGDHEDTYYDISFKEYRPYTVSKISVVDIKAALNKVTTASKTPASNKTTANAPTPTPKEITIGCEVILNGRVHYDSYGSKPGKTFTNYRGVVKLINKKGSHPYCVYTPSGGGLGWVTKESVVLA